MSIELPTEATRPQSISRRSILGAAALGTGTALGAATLGAGSAFAAPTPGRRTVVPTDDGTIAYQTSFETDEPEWLTTSTSYDSTEAKTGARSLKYERTDAADYVLATFELPTEPGIEYEITCAVKTANLDGAYNRGARIALEASGADGWISGSYSGNVRATDWVTARAIYTAPEGALTVRAVVYIYKGITGTAWFDDLTVRIIPPRLLNTELHAPSYRGLIIPGDHNAITLKSHVLVDESELSGYTLSTTLLDNAGTVIDQRSDTAAPVIDYDYPTDDLAIGGYTVRAELRDSSDEVAAAEEWGLEKVDSVPNTYVDKHGRLIRNGEPHFPLGMYNNRIDAEAMDNLNGTPFNTILPYAPQDATALDLAHANGLSVIYSLKDFFYDSTQGAKPDEIVHEEDEVPTIIDYVERLRDHPAMLAWYLADEPSAAQVERLIAHHDAVIAHDAEHPSYVVHYEVPEPPVGDVLRGTDLYGIDTYPVHGEEGEDISTPSDKGGATAELMVNRGMWHVPQSFAWGALSGRTGRFPTQQEFRNMTWQFLCQGATGLIYWELYYMRDDPDLTFDEAMTIASTAAQEVADQVPVLLSIDAPPEATLPDEEWLDVMLKAAEGGGHLFAVNHTQDAQSASFTVPAAVSVTEVGEGRSIEVAPDGSFADDFGALAVHHYEIELVGFGSLSDLTHRYLDEFGANGYRGINRAASQLLNQAEMAQRRGDSSAVADQLASYRELIGDQQGRALSADQATTLIRLSNELTR